MSAKFIAFMVASFVFIFGVTIGAATAALAAPNACAEVCRACSDTCTKTVDYLQKTGGKHAEADRVNTVKDCAKLCDTNADLKSRNSANGADVDKACAKVCSKCAEKCEELNDPKLKDCIALCRKCSNSCEKHTK